MSIQKFFIFFILFSSILRAQSKKEQLEFLNSKIDSLTRMLTFEKSLSKIQSDSIYSQSEIISNLNSIIQKKDQLLLTNKEELNKLNQEISLLQKDLALSINCNDFVYFPKYNSLEKLDSIQNCVNPSFIKAQFYRHYFNLLLFRELKLNETLEGISYEIIMQLIKYREQYLNQYHLLFSEESEVLKSVISLDEQFYFYKSENQKLNETGAFYNELKDFYFGNESDEFIISNYGKYILTFFNLAGATTEANVTQLFEIKNDSIIPVDVYENLLSNLESKIKNKFGKNAFLSRDFQILSNNHQMELQCAIIKDGDPFCCGTAKIKLLTNDFLYYKENSLMYGEVENNGNVKKWIPL